MATTYDSGWWEDSNNVIELVGLTNPDTGLIVSDATVTAKMVGPDGSVVGSINGVTLDHVASEPGTYRKELDVALTPGAIYVEKVTAVAAGGTKKHTFTQRRKVMPYRN